MAEPPTVVNRWKEWQAAKRWARRAVRAKNQDDKMRCWRQMVAHWKAALTGQRPELYPEQLRLLDEQGQNER